MKLDLAYNEMSFLRELVRGKRLEMLREVVGLAEKSGKEYDVQKIEDEMFREPQYSDGGYDYPCLADRHFIARLTRKFQELENSCKQALGLRR